MSYLTYPLSTKAMRDLGIQFRNHIGLIDIEPFDPIMEFERIHTYLPYTTFEVVEDYEHLNSEYAISIIEKGKITIVTSESVYYKASENNDFTCRLYLAKEILFVFLYEIGLMPLILTEFPQDQKPKFYSMSWKLNQLLLEVMVPSEASKDMNKYEIRNRYKVPLDFAEKAWDRNNSQKSILYKYSPQIQYEIEF